MTALLGYNSRTIKFTLLKCTIQWLIVYLWIVQPAPLILESVHHSWSDENSQWPLPHSPIPNPWKSLIYFLFMGWPILEILNKWNHTICSLSLLVFFTQHTVFKVHLCCNLCHYFISLYGQVIFLSIERPHLLIHSPVAGILGFSIFWLLWIMLLWTSVYEFLHEHIFFSSLEYIPRIRTVESNWW